MNNTVVSQRDPAVEIKLRNSVHYVGSDRFLLADPRVGNFDDCELFAFVEPGAKGNIRKLYWVQFEAYLPSHPELHHQYDSPQHVTLGGLDFYVDTWVSAAATPPPPGSDEAHFDSLLASRGYRRNDLMSVRLVHLADAAKRKELMIIYAENIAPTGYTAAQLKKDGAEHAKWPGIEHALISRAEQSILIHTPHDDSVEPPR